MSEDVGRRNMTFRPEATTVPSYITGTVSAIADHLVETFAAHDWDRMVVCIALDTLGLDTFGSDSGEQIRTHWAAVMDSPSVTGAVEGDWVDDFLTEKVDSLVAHRTKVGAGWNFITLRFRHVEADRLAVDSEYRRVEDSIALLNDTDFHVFKMLDD